MVYEYFKDDFMSVLKKICACPKNTTKLNYSRKNRVNK